MGGVTPIHLLSPEELIELAHPIKLGYTEAQSSHVNCIEHTNAQCLRGWTCTGNAVRHGGGIVLWEHFKVVGCSQ